MKWKFPWQKGDKGKQPEGTAAEETLLAAPLQDAVTMQAGPNALAPTIDSPQRGPRGNDYVDPAAATIKMPSDATPGGVREHDALPLTPTPKDADAKAGLEEKRQREERYQRFKEKVQRGREKDYPKIEEYLTKRNLNPYCLQDMVVGEPSRPLFYGAIKHGQPTLVDIFLKSSRIVSDMVPYKNTNPYQFAIETAKLAAAAEESHGQAGNKGKAAQYGGLHDNLERIAEAIKAKCPEWDTPVIGAALEPKEIIRMALRGDRQLIALLGAGRVDALTNYKGVNLLVSLARGGEGAKDVMGSQQDFCDIIDAVFESARRTNGLSALLSSENLIFTNGQHIVEIAVSKKKPDIARHLQTQIAIGEAELAQSCIPPRDVRGGGKRGGQHKPHDQRPYRSVRGGDTEKVLERDIGLL